MLTKVLSRSSLVAGLASILAFAAPQAMGQADETSISQQGAVELTWDHADSGQDVAAATIEYEAAARFAEGWTVALGAVFEPVRDPVGDTTFQDHDAYVETLTVQYAGDAFTLYAGKLNPVFGSAADLAPGLYGVEAGEAYQLTEQVGVGGDIALNSILGLEGEHILSAAVFRADRSALSGSIGGLRDEVRLDDGGLTNTEDFKSVAVSLDGAIDNGLAYSLGYRRLASDTLGEADESMTVLGLSYTLPEETGLELSLVGEIGASRDADGVAGARRDFFTAGAVLGLGDWFVNAVASGWNENAAAGDADLSKFELSAGREIAESLVLEIGVQAARAAGETDTLIGARLAWSFG